MRARVCVFLRRCSVSLLGWLSSGASRGEGVGEGRGWGEAGRWGGFSPRAAPQEASEDGCPGLLRSQLSSRASAPRDLSELGGHMCVSAHACGAAWRSSSGQCHCCASEYVGLGGRMFSAARMDLKSGACHECPQEIPNMKNNEYIEFARRAFHVPGQIPAYLFVSSKAVSVDGIALQALHGTCIGVIPA